MCFLLSVFPLFKLFVLCTNVYSKPFVYQIIVCSWQGSSVLFIFIFLLFYFPKETSLFLNFYLYQIQLPKKCPVSPFIRMFHLQIAFVDVSSLDCHCICDMGFLYGKVSIRLGWIRNVNLAGDEKETLKKLFLGLLILYKGFAFLVCHAYNNADRDTS